MTISSKKIKTYSENETFKLGKRIAKAIAPGDIIGFMGELGSGKTVLIKGILSGLGFDENYVSSASFVLAQEYDAKYPVVHIDLYRLLDKSQICELDWASYLSKDTVVLIEWAERLDGHISIDMDINIVIISEDEREFLLKSSTAKLQRFMNI